MRAKSRRLVGIVVVAVLPWLSAGCATDELKPKRPKRPSDRRWYQGDMDNQDRSFFLDSFFKSG